MNKRVLASVGVLVAATALLAGCGQQVAGTSTTASNPPSVATVATSAAKTSPAAQQTVTATASATKTVTAAPKTSTKPPEPEPETVTQTPPPVVVVPAPRVTVTQAPSTVYVPQSDSAADQQVAADWLTAEVMAGSWIPQLSSNPDSPTAMAKYRALSSAYSGVFMVASKDFTSFRNPGYYVTMVALPFSTPEEANAWCDAQGFAAEDCLAKRLSHVDGPDGSTVERG
jgi:serine/threonine-protein kinase